MCGGLYITSPTTATLYWVFFLFFILRWLGKRVDLGLFSQKWILNLLSKIQLSIFSKPLFNTFLFLQRLYVGTKDMNCHHIISPSSWLWVLEAISWLVVSNALWRSINIPVYRPSSKSFRISVKNERHRLFEWLVLNPDCWLYRKLFFAQRSK